MKHPRADYDRIQDPDNKIPKDEPVILLRAQDKLACLAMDYYVELCKKYQPEETVTPLEEHAKLMHAWPNKKIPDVPT